MAADGKRLYHRLTVADVPAVMREGATVYVTAVPFPPSNDKKFVHRAVSDLSGSKVGDVKELPAGDVDIVLERRHRAEFP